MVRPRSFIVVASVLAATGVAAGAAYLYDAGRDDLIAKGVRVGGVDVGGLRAAPARARLEREVIDPLRSAVRVRSGDRRFHLTAREARLRADVDGMVREAVARSRRGGIFARVARGLTGGRVDAALPAAVAFSSEAVGRLVSRVVRGVERPARDAELRYSASGITAVAGHDGLAVNRRALRRRVEAQLVSPRRATVRVPVRRTRPALTRRALAKRNPWVVIVDRAGFRLRLFHDLRLEKTYRIAVGQVGLETPAGLYHVQDKAINPAWHVPKRPWAGKLAGKVIPGGVPENPIKARWLGIYDGAGIHGTAAVGSLGSAASHGCVRMAIPDVIEVYDRVPVGAAIFIA